MIFGNRINLWTLRHSSIQIYLRQDATRSRLMPSSIIQLDRYHSTHQRAWLCTYYVHTMVYPPHIIGWCLDYVSVTLSSFAQALGATMVPKEMNYLIPGAQGNTATCTAQGFLINLGAHVVALYNCSICYYYLSIIRYNEKDAYIRDKLEPWFHGISTIIPLVCRGFVFIAMKGYNEYESVCYLRPNYPPHCIGYENGDTPEGFSIPCGRGNGGENPILYFVTWIVSFGSTMIVTPTVIVGTMLLMYRSVSKIEERMQNYGVSILRLTTTRPGRGNRGNSTRDASNDQHDGVMCRVKRFCMGMIPPCIHRRDDQVPTSRSNRATSQKRAILYMAAGYALAWAFVCIPFMINFFVHESYATLILHVCLRLCLTPPLQGLFNFLVFMSPKVRSAKRSRDVASSFYQGIHVERRKEENGGGFKLKTYSYCW
jgi:hypothetical protein